MLLFYLVLLLIFRIAAPNIAYISLARSFPLLYPSVLLRSHSHTVKEKRGKIVLIGDLHTLCDLSDSHPSIFKKKLCGIYLKPYKILIGCNPVLLFKDSDNIGF